MTQQNQAGVRSAVLLCMLALVAVVLLSILQVASRDRSEANRKARLDRQLGEVLADVARDNDPALDVFVSTDPRLGTDSPMPIYRARKDKKATALVMTSVAPDGYSGDIRLLIGVDINGTVLGTRVLEHRETPGIGDRIERRRGDWITLMDHRSLNEPASDHWHTGDPDGAFDAITGATITSDAVVSAVRKALLWFEDNRETVLARQADPRSDTMPR